MRLDRCGSGFTVGEPWWRSDISVPPGHVSWQADNGNFLRHQNYVARTSPITAGNPATDLQDATFNLVPGLADDSCYSFEAVNFPGSLSAFSQCAWGPCRRDYRPTAARTLSLQLRASATTG